jgi:hypothetical protein
MFALIAEATGWMEMLQSQFRLFHIFLNCGTDLIIFLTFGVVPFQVRLGG